MKLHSHITKQGLLIAALLITMVSIAQSSDVNSFLRERLMVYYVENPSSDQYRLLNPNEIISGQELFGGNPDMEIAQNFIREIFTPADNMAFQESVVEALGRHSRPVALFIYHDRGPLDEAVASANWTNCIANGHFTSCVTSEEEDEYAAIVHYGSEQMNADEIDLAKNRLLSLLGNTHSTQAQIVRSLPTGKGMFVENFRGAEPTSEAFAVRAAENGITWIAFQGANQNTRGENTTSQSNSNRALTIGYVERFRDTIPNAQVYVWGWPMANSSDANIRAFIDRLIEKATWVDAQGIILDTEGPAHGVAATAWNSGTRANRMRFMMDYALQQAHAQNLSVGISSYGSSLHRFPHEEMRRADFGIPQLYSPRNEIFESETSAIVKRSHINYVRNGIRSWERLGFRGKVIVASATVTERRKSPEQIQALLDITAPHLPNQSIVWWRWNNHNMGDARWQKVNDFIFQNNDIP